MKGAWIVISLFATARALPSPVRRLSSVMDDSTIRTAVTAWLADPTAAETTYGHISTWETGGVTDMSELFPLVEAPAPALDAAAAAPAPAPAEKDEIYLTQSSITFEGPIQLVG